MLGGENGFLISRSVCVKGEIHEKERKKGKRKRKNKKEKEKGKKEKEKEKEKEKKKEERRKKKEETRRNEIRAEVTIERTKGGRDSRRVLPSIFHRLVDRAFARENPLSLPFSAKKITWREEKKGLNLLRASFICLGILRCFFFLMCKCVGG